MLEFLGGLLVDLVVPYRVQLIFYGLLVALVLLVGLFIWLGV